MAFLKGQKDTITLETVATWDEDLGKTGTDKFRTTWRTMKVSDKERIFAASKEDGWNAIDEIHDRLVSWDYKDRESGEVVPLTRDALNEMLDEQGYRDALSINIKTLMLGHKVAVEKN